ncbi:MAG TPA: hypothetical protein VFP12_10425 [Allosphingosinicella sp.]|nr:hypothetical protein [Allosphingosinicella sp.]
MPALREDLLDPDPFTVAAVSMAAISLVAQLAQTYKAYRPGGGPPNPGSESNRVNRLESLEQEVENLARRLDKTLRVVDRGSQSPEPEFYAAPLRAGRTVMLMSSADLNRFGGALADMIASLSGMARWIDHIISQDPLLASSLGKRLNALDGSVERLNRAMAEGRATREVIEECKSALDQLTAAIEAELRSAIN